MSHEVQETDANMATIARLVEENKQLRAQIAGLNLVADQYSVSRDRWIMSRDMWMQKANAEIVRAAQAGLDAYALYEAMQEALDCGCKGVHFVDIEGEAEAEACDLWIELDDRLQAFKNGEHPGAALLVERDELKEQLTHADHEIAAYADRVDKAETERKAWTEIGAKAQVDAAEMRRRIIEWMDAGDDPNRFPGIEANFIFFAQQLKGDADV